MLDSLLGLSAAFLVGTTVLIVIAGRLPLGYPARIGVVVGLTIIVGVISGNLDLARIERHPPGIGDPLILVAAAILVVSLLAPPRWWAAGSVLFASLIVATGAYTLFLAQSTILLALSPLSLVLGLFLLVFEVLALVLMITSLFEMLDALCRPMTLPGTPTAPATWPTVAFQVPAHEEPPDLLINTIHSLVAVEYPRERLVVQVIDNNTKDESLWRPVEAECARLAAEGYRVVFAHLADWPGFKAGALNWGTKELPEDVEIVAVVDSDYVVKPGFLAATVPYFQDSSVAFVQTPQEYREWKQSWFYRACHTGFAYFFAVGMVSRAYHNAIIFAGTMGLLRRDILDEIGGWDEAVITEDAEASLRILARGYRGVYLPRAFGEGIMPLTYEGLRQQRFRWAFGGMQILRKHWRNLLPGARSGLTWRQKRDYLLGSLGWVNDALTLGFTLFIAATAVGVATHHPFAVQRLEGPGLVLPILYIVLALVRYLWGLRVATGASLAESIGALRVNLSLSWIVTLACIRGLYERRGVFLRTPKFQGPAAARSARLVAVELGIAVAGIVLAIGTFLAAQFSVLTLTIVTLLAWSTLIFGSAADFAFGDPQRPPADLRQKATSQLTQGAVGQVLRAAPATGAVIVAVVAALTIAVGLIGERNNAPVPGIQALVPPAEPAPTQTARPSPSGSPGASPSVAPSESAVPSGSPPPSAPATSPPAATPTPTPTTAPSAAPSSVAPASAPAASSEPAP